MTSVGGPAARADFRGSVQNPGGRHVPRRSAATRTRTRCGDGPDRERDVGARRADGRVPRATGDARGRGLDGVGRDAALERPVRARDHLHRDRVRCHGRLSPAVHPPQLQDDPPRARAAGRARLDGGRGPRDRVGRHAPQAPPLLGRRRRPAQPARRPGAGLARRAARPRPRPPRLDVPRQGHGQPRALRQGPARRPRPALHQPHVPALGRRRPRAPLRPRPRPHRVARRRPDRAAVGRRRAHLPPAPRRPSASTRCVTSSAGGRSPPATSRATSPGSRRSRSARPGTTTTTRSRPRRVTASAATRSIRAPGSSARWPATHLAWDVVQITPTRQQQKRRSGAT